MLHPSIYYIVHQLSQGLNSMSTVNQKYPHIHEQDANLENRMLQGSRNPPS